ncbi:hypothetical protein MN608_10142 [Microdochium nivale]|nr:hypothetical protein MN608_10142 [Microdochium nivale]
MVAPSCLYTAMSYTIMNFFADYERAAAGSDAPIISTTLTPDCRRYFRPQSFLDAAGFPPGYYFNNTAYEASVGPELGVTQTANWTIISLSIDEQQRTAAALTEYRVRLCGSHEYFLEFGWTWFFDKTGHKIQKIIEFVDPVAALREAADAADLAATGVKC